MNSENFNYFPLGTDSIAHKHFESDFQELNLNSFFYRLIFFSTASKNISSIEF